MSEPTIQQLRYLVAIAEHLHFGKAAEACHVTQPALSAQLRELEKRLGTELVERAARRVLLTPAGEVATVRARAVLQAVDELVDAATCAAGELQGLVTVGVIPTMAPYLLPRIVQTFTSRFPDAQLHLREQRTDELLSALRAGTVDLGILALPIESAQGVHCEPLAADPFLLAVAESHPLARSRRPASLDELARQPVLLLEEGHCLRDQALAVCDVAGASPSSIQATSLPTAVQMVASGLGVTLLPASAVPVEARAGNGVAVRPLRAPAPSRTIGLVWRDTSPRHAAFVELSRLLRPLLAPGTNLRTN